MKQKICNKVVTLLAVLSLVLGLIPCTYSVTAKAEETENVVVCVAVDSLGVLNASGSAVKVSKTPVHLSKGSTATDAIKVVLDKNNIPYEIVKSSYGDYYSDINGLSYDMSTGSYWMFTLNGTEAEVGTSNYTLKNGDKISFLYQAEFVKAEADSFNDDNSKDPDENKQKELISKAKSAQNVLSKTLFEKVLDNGNIVPGLESPGGLNIVYTLKRAGFDAGEYYDKVYKNLLKQLTAIENFGGVRIKEQIGEEDNGEPIYDYRTLSFSDLDSSSLGIKTYASAILFLGACGKDASNVCGLDLTKKVTNLDILDAAANGYSKHSVEGLALLSMNSKDYTYLEGSEYTTKEDLTNILLSDIDNQIDNDVTWGGVDNATMAIAPLYNSDFSENQGLKDEVFSLITNYQDVNGDYVSYGSTNPWTLAQVMLTAGLYKVNVLDDTLGYDFIKNGNTLIDSALNFVDIENEEVSDVLMSYAPEQLLQGLTSVILAYENEAGFYDLTEVTMDVTNYSDEEIYKEVSEEYGVPYESASPSSAPTASTVPNVTESPSTSPSGAPTASAVPNVTESPSASPSESPAATSSSEKYNTKKIKLSKKSVKIKKGKKVKIKVTLTKKNKSKAYDKITVSLKNKKFKKAIKIKKVKKFVYNVKVTKKAKKKSKIKIVFKAGKKSKTLTVKVK